MRNGQWPLLKLTQQVIFSNHVTKNYRIAGEWSLMQVPANRHMTDSTKTSFKIIFIDFFVDFSNFAKAAETSLIDPVICWFNLAHLDKDPTSRIKVHEFGPRSIKTRSIRSYQDLFVHFRIGLFGNDPSVSFQFQQIKFFLRYF